MTKTQWIFPAISCIPLSMILMSEYFFVGIILYIGWFIRILFLKHKETLVATAIIGVLFSGGLLLQHQGNHTVLENTQTQFIVYPEITSIKINGDSLRFEGRVMTEDNEEKVVVSYKLSSETEKEMWSEDPLMNHLFIEGGLEEPLRNSNFNQFNYQDYLKRQNIYWQLQANSIQSINNSSLNKPMFYQIDHLRNKIFNYIDDTFHSKIASYLKILFFADKRDISETILQSYRSIGVIHLFSISGFHITYLANLIRRLLLRIGITHERTNLIVLIILPVYGLLAGFGVSVFRAVFQTAILLIGKIKHLNINTLDAWSLTMILALFVNPYQVFDISFQLSYLLSGIFIMMGSKRWTRELNAITSALLFSFMSGLASLPILAYHFFEVSWITIFANLLFIPFFTYLLFPALLILFSLASFLKATPIFIFLNEFLATCITMIENGLTFLTTTFDFSFVIGRLPILIMLLLIWSVFKILTKIESKKFPSLFSLGVLVFSLFYYQISPVGYVLMLDIGQGDSILIKEPITGKVTMIDTGGRVEWYTKEPWQEQEDSFTIGKDVTVPALKSLGISNIDRLYITHADLDHAGEIENIGKIMSVNEIVATEGTFNDEMVAKQVDALENTTLKILKPPLIVDYPVKDTVAIHPINVKESNNNDSLTLYGKIGHDTWLFTGDLEVDGEKQVINRYPNLKATHLKVAHHGSKTSTSQAFLNHIQADEALISAGRNNTFGHPNEEVIKRLEKMGINILTTAEEGAIMFKYIKWPFSNQWFTETNTVYKN